MTLSSHLALPYLEAAQAQKHVTHNEALRIIDALTMLAVLDRDLSSPPASPGEGDRYIVKAPGAGAFSGKDNRVAHFIDDAWAFLAPSLGWICHVRDEGAFVAWDGAAWQPAIDFVHAISALQGLTLLGLGATADATNPFSAKLNNALWTARAAAEGGTGDLRYKLNKEGAANTLSLLFQTGYAGRAEIGLAGDDDFHFKVSSDGSAWKEAIKIDRASGTVSCPSGLAGVRERLSANRTYYVRTDGNDANNGLSNSAGGAFRTLQHAWDIIAGLDLSIYTVTVQIADGTYAGITATAVPVGANSIVFQGNAAAPANVVINSANGFFIGGPAQITVKDLKLACSGTCLYTQHPGAALKFANLDFGASGDHIRSDAGQIYGIGNYAISGGAGRHLLGGPISLSNIAVTLSGAPNFSGAFALIAGLSAITLWNVTWVGAATGQRYSVSGNGVINTFGQSTTWLPGSVAGATSAGGQYL